MCGWECVVLQEEPKEGDAAAMETDAADEAEIGPQPAPEGGEPMQEE